MDLVGTIMFSTKILWNKNVQWNFAFTCSFRKDTKCKTFRIKMTLLYGGSAKCKLDETQWNY